MQVPRRCGQTCMARFQKIAQCIDLTCTTFPVLQIRLDRLVSIDHRLQGRSVFSLNPVQDIQAGLDRLQTVFVVFNMTQVAPQPFNHVLQLVGHVRNLFG